jgi:hypothetical protein
MKGDGGGTNALAASGKTFPIACLKHHNCVLLPWLHLFSPTQVIQCHQAFLARATDGLLLSRPRLLRPLLGLQQGAFAFCGRIKAAWDALAQEQVCHPPSPVLCSAAHTDLLAGTLRKA